MVIHTEDWIYLPSTQMDQPEQFKSVKTVLYFFKDWNIHDVKRNCLIDLSF